MNYFEHNAAKANMPAKPVYRRPDSRSEHNANQQMAKAVRK